MSLLLLSIASSAAGEADNATCLHACANGSINSCSHACPNELELAKATFEDTLLSTGWGVLNVRGSDPHAMGKLEGCLTRQHIYDSYLTNMDFTFGCVNMSCVPKAVRAFMTKQDEWARAQVSARPHDPFWVALGGLLAQYDGLTQGYHATSSSCYQPAPPPLPDFAFQLLNGVGDLFQIIPSVIPSKRPDWTRMNQTQTRRELERSGHCSGLVRVLPGFEDLLMGHSSWFEYPDMNRIFKYYTLEGTGLAGLKLGAGVSSRTVSFSSYPGYLESLDDFYMMDSGLGMVQTSNGVPNSTLLDLITPESLLAWQRVRVASLLANTGEEWYTTFKTAASGTYVNQYMVVDFNRFTPSKPLQPGTLWVVEEIPGLVEGADQTPTLARGFWPSYNVPFYAEVYRRSGYADAFDGAAPLFDGGGAEYQIGAPRSKLFREHASSVVSMPTFQQFMRYANYSDPYAIDPKTGAVDYHAAICMRGDLAGGGTGKAGGCYDSKVTSYLHGARELKASVVNGPSSSASAVGSTNAPFTWRPFDGVHAGLPAVFDFPWRAVAP